MPSTMDFFEHQEAARRGTARLIVLYALAVLATMAGTYLVVVAFVSWQTQEPLDLWNPKLLAYVGGGVLAVVAFGTSSKFFELRGGGTVVARSLGGRLLSPATRDPLERKVLNVVDEMSIASGVPVPDVYLLDRETRINAFAAGHAPEEAVIGVTRGAAEVLTRDELQGVIAHEFSHVLNGDMRLNLRLLSVLHGILVIGLLGGMLLRASLHSGRSSRRNKSGGSGAIAVLGLALMALGYLGTFFGKLIKAGVSRRREFLADASAVAFTRNPSGIAGALKKIGGSTGRARIVHARAAEYSHMYFGEGIASPLHLLATHPPLDERIRRIEPRWNGLYPTVAPLDPREEPAQPAPQHAPAAAAAFAGAVAQVGRPTPDHLAYAQTLLDATPDGLLDALRTTRGAEAFVYALFRRGPEDDAKIPEPTRGTTRDLAPLLQACDEAARLPLLDLALPALRRMDRASYRAFLSAVDALVLADGEVSPYEWAMRRVLRSYLAPAFGTVRRPVVQYYNLRGLRKETACLLSALARAGHDDDAGAARAFEAGASQLEVDRIALQPAGACGVDALDRAVEGLAQAAAPAKRQLLEACARAIRADRQVTVREGELLRAVADSLGCPMPPLLPGQPLA